MGVVKFLTHFHVGKYARAMHPMGYGTELVNSHGWRRPGMAGVIYIFFEISNVQKPLADMSFYWLVSRDPQSWFDHNPHLSG